MDGGIYGLMSTSNELGELEVFTNNLLREFTEKNVYKFFKDSSVMIRAAELCVARQHIIYWTTATSILIDTIA